MQRHELKKYDTSDTSTQPCVAHQARHWLMEHANEFPFALTLTFKQCLLIKNVRGTYLRTLEQRDCERIAHRFAQKLNRSLFGRRADRHAHRRLRFIGAIEDGHGTKNLHLHLAIGNWPATVPVERAESLVADAIRLVDGLDKQFRFDPTCDSGWMDYLCKEFPRNNIDRLLLSLGQ